MCGKFKLQYEDIDAYYLFWIWYYILDQLYDTKVLNSRFRNSLECWNSEMQKEIHDVLLPTPQHAEIIFVKRKKCIKKHFKITFLKHILKNNALGKNWISITVTL